MWVQWRPGPLQCCHGPVFLCRGLPGWRELLLLAPSAEAAPGCGRTLLDPPAAAIYTSRESEATAAAGRLSSHVSECRVWLFCPRMPAGIEEKGSSGNLCKIAQQIRRWNAAELSGNSRKNLGTGTLTGFESARWREMVRCCE